MRMNNSCVCGKTFMALPIGVQAWYAYICLYACKHGLFACMDACMRENVSTAGVCSCMHTRARMHTDAGTRAFHSRKYHTHTHTHTVPLFANTTHILAQTHSRTHTSTRARAHARTHTRTHSTIVANSASVGCGPLYDTVNICAHS